MPTYYIHQSNNSPSKPSRRGAVSRLALSAALVCFAGCSPEATNNDKDQHGRPGDTTVFAKGEIAEPIPSTLDISGESSSAMKDNSVNSDINDTAIDTKRRLTDNATEAAPSNKAGSVTASLNDRNNATNKLTFTNLKPPSTPNANGWIEHLASIDKRLRELMQAANRGQLTREEATEQALTLSQMKLAAAESLDKASEKPVEKELATLARMEGLSHAAGLGDDRAAAQLRLLALQNTKLESPAVAHRAANVLLGFSLSDLAGGLSSSQDVINQLDAMLKDKASLTQPDFLVCAQTLTVLQQHNAEEAYNVAKQKIIDAFGDSTVPQIGMQTWYLQMSDSATFAAVNEAVSSPEQSAQVLQRALTLHLASAPPSQWFVVWLMQNTTGIEYSGQVDKAGVMIAAIDESKDWVKNEELRKNADTIVSGYKLRINSIGKSLDFSGLVSYPDSKPFDPDSLKGKFVVVDFWASWCGPCRAEFPHLREFYTKYKDRGLEIVGINLDESPEAMQQVFDAETIPWIHLRSNDNSAIGFKTPLAVELGVTAIPFVLFLNQDGKVLAIHTRGTLLAKRLEELFP